MDTYSYERIFLRKLGRSSGREARQVFLTTRITLSSRVLAGVHAAGLLTNSTLVAHANAMHVGAGVQSCSSAQSVLLMI